MSVGDEHWKAWGQHIAIAGAYAACYQIAYQLSLPEWELTAGLRLCCLIIVPVRLWPALALGEFFPVVQNAVMCLKAFGPAWSLAASVPQIIFCMACMKPLRRRWKLRDAEGRVQMGYVLTASLCCALMITIRNTVAFWVAIASSTTDWGPELTVTNAFSSYMLGNYLGSLTLVPVMLAIQDRIGIVPASFARTWRSPLLRDAVLCLTPILAILTWQANMAHTQEIRQLARFAMIVPMLGMAIKYHLHGMAVAGMAVSIAMSFTSTLPHLIDIGLVHCEVVLSFIISAGLLLAGKTHPVAQSVLRSARRLPR